MTRTRRIVAALSTVIGTGVGYACSCIAAGSRVRTPTGHVDIADLRVGDLVLSFDVRTGCAEPTTVVAIRRAHRECVAVRIGSRRLVCTPEHPLYAPETGTYEPASWFAANERRMIQIATTEMWSTGVVDSVEAFAGMHDVFDISVASPHHNFAAEGVLVHNKSPAPTSRIKFVCNPSDTETEQCPRYYTCCSDDPAAVGGALPSYAFAEPPDAATPFFAAENNALSISGFCASPGLEPTLDGENFEIVDCPRPCNPTWSPEDVAIVCGDDVPCCQTKLLTPADCIRDETTGLWRVMDGGDAEAAALRGAARWGEGGTHQDPDFAGCEAYAGARSGEVFLDCVRQLGVANQRGFCGGNSDFYDSESDGSCSADAPVDICAARND